MDFQIFDYGMNGEGVARLDNKIVLIDNALIGETIDAEISLDKGNYCFGKVNKILKESINRTTPPCPYFFDCGGCNLQHMKYLEQLKFKTLLIKKTIKKILNIDVAVNDCIASDFKYNYRNKMSFNFNETSSGFYKEKSKAIIEIKKCILADEEINNIYLNFKKFLKNKENIAKNTQKYIKNLVIRKISNQILIGIVSTKPLNLTDFYKNFDKENVGIFNVVNTRKDSVVLSGKVIHLFGIKEIEITNFGLTYFVDLIGFHQTNINIQNKIYKKVLDYITPNSFVVNGFSGQGLLSAVLATKAKKVVGIEINKNSHASAERLKLENNIKNLKNICGDFNKEIKSYKPHLLVLDPAKKGVGKDFLDKITAKEIVYISCNPIAMCKDLKILLNNYTIEEITPFDMFPNTKNVETVLHLKHK